MRHFDDWLNAGETQRARQLAALEADDAIVFARVKALIKADARIDALHFMQGAALLDIEAEHAVVADGDLAGARIGPWRIERLLGRGGMGEVWLAMRDDGAHRGRAAIKLLRNLRGDGPARERFLREGQILARLEHPHIARLLDAGDLGDGRRYLVLEYVDGERIDDWCNRRRLPIAARLDLFVQVCAAVAYAHANLVVHRDLKPSNIFVDAQGNAKLLDFGVAKLIDDEEPSMSLTRPSGVAITPEYAAPEQIENRPVTVATDVYALGNVLYVLLAGRKPYGDDLATPALWARAIVETEPRRLSLSTVDGGEETRRRAHERATTPEQWRRVLRGDPETIVAKALKKNPAERYVSVQAFADDIRRYLEHQPILARDDGWWYRTRKFARRHRVGVGASVLLALTIGAGVFGVVWQARIARREAEHAQRSQKFLVGVLEDLNPYGSRDGKRPNTADAIGNTLARIESDFADAPVTQIELRETISRVLFRLDDIARARDVARANLDAMRAIYSAASPELGVGWQTYGQYSTAAGDLDAAAAAFTRADAVLRDAGPAWAKSRIGLMTNWAKLENLRGDHIAARRHHDAVLRERRAMEGEKSPDIAMDLMNLAADDLYAENFAEAEARAREAHAMLIELLGAEHARRIYIDNVLGLAQAHAGHVADAIETLRGADVLAQAKLPADSAQRGAIRGSLGVAQFYAGDFSAAIDSLHEAQRLKYKDPSSGRTTLWLGRAELAAKRTEALATLHEARDALSNGNGGGSDGFAELARAAYAAALARGGEAEQGAALAGAARADLLAGKNASSVRLADIDLLIADIAEWRGMQAEARMAREEALSVYGRVLGESHPRTRALAGLLETVP